MIKNLIKKFEAKRRGTPLKVSDDGRRSVYAVKCKTQVDGNGGVKQILDAKSVLQVILADKSGIDDPKKLDALYASFCEEVRVRRIVRDELNKAFQRAQQAAQQKLIETVVQQEREPESPQPALIAREPDDVGQTDASAVKSAASAANPDLEPAPITRAEALSVIVDPANRALVDAYLDEHPLVEELATCGRGTLRVVIRNGQVARVGYRDQTSRRA